MPRNSVMHQGDLVYQIERLQQALIDRTSGRSLENSSIGAGGLDIIEGGHLEINGGELRLIAPNGVTVARWGDVSFGGVSRGWEMNYENGKRAFGLGGDPAHPIWQLWDNSGNYLVTNDGATNVGLARPYLNYILVPSRDSEVVTNGPFWPSVEGSSYTELFTGKNTIHHPKVAFSMATTAVSGDTEWQFLIDDSLIASGSGGVSEVYEIPGWGEDIQPVTQHTLKVEVRQSDGTRAWAQIDRCFGRQSL